MSESKYSTRKPNDNIENGVAYARGGKQKSGGAGADDELPLNPLPQPDIIILFAVIVTVAGVRVTGGAASPFTFFGLFLFLRLRQFTGHFQQYVLQGIQSQGKLLANG
mgnify:CR=1 FL=1